MFGVGLLFWCGFAVLGFACGVFGMLIWDVVCDWLDLGTLWTDVSEGLV